MRNRLRNEIDRMSEKEAAIVSRSEHSFFAWLINTMQKLFGHIVEGIQKFFEWLFAAIRQKR